jgi:hypothetical protein
MKVKANKNKNIPKMKLVNPIILISESVSPMAKYSAAYFCPAPINPKSAYERKIEKLIQTVYMP